jgi:hypothetical protein
MSALPTQLPVKVDQLIEELDELNPEPVVSGILIDPEEIQELVYRSGRRSLVEELIRLRDKAKEAP